MKFTLFYEDETRFFEKQDVEWKFVNANELSSMGLTSGVRKVKGSSIVIL